MRSLWADKYDLREACDNTLLIAERCEVAFTEGSGTYMPRFPVPDGRDRADLVRQGGRGRAAAPLPGRHPRRGARAGRLRGRRHRRRWASPATSWWSPTSSTGPRTNGIRVGPGPRLRRRARWSPTRCGITDLDPLEHGLIFERFLNPDRVSMPDFDIDFDERRRGEVDPLRHREVRRRPGRADRHLRHDQGQAGGQGRRPRARLPVRDGRPDHQGDAAAGDGQGRPARRRSSTRRTSGTARAASSARCTRPTPRSRRSSTPPAGWRASSGSGACTPPA